MKEVPAPLDDEEDGRPELVGDRVGRDLQVFATIETAVLWT